MRAAFPAVVLATSICILAEPAGAQVPPDIGDLHGARSAGGETQLEARGYMVVDTNIVRDTRWTTWWNSRLRQCVQVATSDGRYSAINRVPEANCRAVATPLPGSPVRPMPLPSRPDYRPQPDYDGAGYGDRYGPSLTLICFGGGSAPTTRYDSGYRYNPRNHKFEPSYGTSVGRDAFVSDVQIEIWHGRGRIHLDGRLIPPINSRGDNGWWDIEDLAITPDRITGQYRLNGLNKPRFEIDRRAQTIRIRAATDFRGRCDAGNWRGSAGF